MTVKQWWKGSRGEWYPVVQAALLVLLLLGPRTWQGVPEWSGPCRRVGSMTGGILLLAGLVLAAAGALNLGRNLTPLPRPKEHGTLVVTGAYRLVRHPIYSGITFMALGWGLWLHSWPTLGYALLVFIALDVKSRREERWLVEKFPEYATYRRAGAEADPLCLLMFCIAVGVKSERNGEIEYDKKQDQKAAARYLCRNSAAVFLWQCRRRNRHLVCRIACLFC